LTKVFSSIEILVLKDRDISSGKITSDNDRANYLKNNPKNHRVLKRWEIENYLYDKDVLVAYCAGNGLVFDEQDYDKFVTDIVNKNLKDDTSRIKNICGINTNVDPEKFKLNLSNFLLPSMPVFKELEDCIFNQ
jgi:hypothetical protein